ncbi:hypothetical protein, partial [Flavobacterium sp.]|uniref:hypothetical protein n=1 Tax=Flavobacterium sp. TaxID=239 RepID=UPI0037BFB04C
LGIKDAAKLVPMAEDQKPVDPITENQNLLTSTPVKAFSYQDHQAHIAVHMSFLQDPKIQSLLQNNPQAQAIGAAAMAHVNEHLGFAYRIQIEQQLGMSLPPQTDEAGEDTHMPPEVEARLAPLLAQAATQLLMQNQAQAAQQQAQQQAQDPIIQMQQQELQIKAAEQQRKAQKDQIDAQLKQEQLQIERERIATQTQTEMAKTAVQAQQAKEKLSADMVKQTKDLFAKGLDNAHKHMGSKSQREHQAKQSEIQAVKPKEKPTKGE